MAKFWAYSHEVTKAKNDWFGSLQNRKSDGDDSLLKHWDTCLLAAWRPHHPLEALNLPRSTINFLFPQSAALEWYCIQRI